MNKSFVFRLASGLTLSTFIITAAMAEGPTDKAVKYHEILRKRPSSGYVFDRFYDTWLDNGTAEELKTYLSKAATAGKPNDHLLLAYYYLRQGKELEALKLYQKSIKTSPENSKIRLEKAKLEAQLLNFDGALKDLEAAVAKANDEEKLDIEHLRGLYLARSGRLEEATMAWKALLKARPNDADLIDSILEVQLAEGLFEEALATSALQIKNTKDPYQKVVFTLRRGDIYQRSGKRKKAIDTYVSTLDAVGENSWIEREILAQLREIFRRDDDMEGLKKLYNDLIVKHPQRVGLQKANAYLLASLGENDQAEKLFRGILKITPGNRKNREELISLLIKAGKTKEALEEVTVLAKTNPKDANLQLKLAAVQHAAGKKGDIPASLNNYLILNSKGENAYLKVVGLLKKYQQPELAVKELRNALKAHPESEECQDALAYLLIDLKQKDEAIKIWKQMVGQATREGVIRHTRSLKSASEDKLAYELLVSRSKDFKTDLVYLTYLTNEAMTRKDFDRASGCAKDILKLSKHSEELRQAVKLNATVAIKAQKEVEVTTALAKNKTRSPVESWLLAELYELQGQSKESVKVLEQLRAEDANIAAVAEVALYEHRGDWKKAAESMERILALPKGRKPIHLRRLVDFYVRLDDSKNALKHIETWKQIAAGDKTPWFKQAEIFGAEGKREQAIQTLRRAAQRYEGDNEFRARLAGLYQENYQFGDAERLYWRLYEEAKNLNERMRWVPSLSEVYEAQGKSTQLIVRFKERRKSNRKSVGPLLAMAEIHRFNENYEERRKSMMEAARLRPNDPDILFAIAQIEEREGDIERATDTLNKAIVLDNSDQSKRYLAQFYMRNGEVDKGVAMIKELVGGTNANPRDLEKAAATIANSGDTEAALKFVDESLIKASDDYRLSYLKAIFLVEEKRYEDALNQLVDTLSMDRELIGVKPIMSQDQWQAQFQQSGGFLPKSQISLVYDNYAARLISNKSRGNPYARRSSRGRQPVSYVLPGDLKEKQPLVEGSIIWVINQLDDELKAKKLIELTAGGLQDLEYRLLLSQATGGSSGGNNFDILKEYARKNPTRPDVFTFPVMIEVMQMMYGGFRNSQKKPDIEFLQFAMENAKNLGDFQSFSIELSLLEKKDDKQVAGAWERAMGHAEKIKEESIGAASMILAITLLKNKELKPNAHAKGIDLARRWYWKSFESNQPSFKRYGAGLSRILTNLIIRDLVNQEKNEKLIEFLEKACAAHAKLKNKSSSAKNNMMMHGQSSGKNFPLPPFPPENQNNIPSFIVDLFKKEGPGNRMIIGGIDEEALDMESLSLGKFIAHVKNPYLRIHIAQFYDDDKALAAGLKEIASEEKPTLEAMLYQAGCLAESEKLIEASKLLAQARYLPMQRAQRKRLDGYLTALALGLAVSGDKAKSADAMDEGRRAALRLRKSTSSAKERERLIIALDDLGLQKEADLVLSSAPVPASSSTGGSGNSADRMKQLEEAIKNKEKEKSQRLALREVKRFTRRPLDWNTTREMKRLRKLIKKANLTDLIKKSMMPGDSTSMRHRGDYALTLNLLGEADEAVKLMEELGKAGSKDPVIMFTLAFALPENRVAEAAEYLDKALNLNSNVSQSTSYKFRELDNEGVDAWLRGYNLLGEYLHLQSKKKPSPKAKHNVSLLNWVEGTGNDFFASEYVDGISFPSIADASYPEKIKKDKKGVMKKRMNIARRLLEGAMLQPELASWAFPHYEASYVSMHEEGKLDMKWAFEAHKNIVKFSVDGESNNYPNSGYQRQQLLMHQTRSLGEGVFAKTPLSYIASQSCKIENKNLFTPEYLDELKKIDPKSVKRITLLQKYLKMTKDQLEAEFAKLLATEKMTLEVLKKIDTLSDILLLQSQVSPSFEQWISSKMSLDDTEIWMSQFSMVRHKLPRYIEILMAEDSSKVGPLLKLVVIGLVQPEGELTDFMAKHQKNSYFHDAAMNDDMRISMTLTVIQGLISTQNLAATMHVARCMKQCGFNESDDYYKLTNQIARYSPSRLADVLIMFDRSGFGQLETAEELICGEQRNTKTPLIGLLVSRLSSRLTQDSSSSYIQIEDVEKVLPSLNKAQQLFLRMTLAVKGHSGLDKKKLMLDIMTDHGDVISKWNPEMNAWFTENVIKKTIYDAKLKAVSIPKDYPKAIKLKLKKFDQSLQNSLGKELDVILGMKKLKDVSEHLKALQFLVVNSEIFIKNDRQKYVKACGNVAVMSRGYRTAHCKENQNENPFRDSYTNDLYDGMYCQILKDIKIESPGDVISLLYEIHQAEGDGRGLLPLSGVELGSDEIKILNSNLISPSSNADKYCELLSKMIKDYEKLPDEQLQLASICVLHFIQNSMRASQKTYLKCYMHVRKLQQKNKTHLKLAMLVGIGGKIMKTVNQELRSNIAETSKNYYDGISDVSDRMMVAQILSKNMGEVFCDDLLQSLAVNDIAESMKKLDLHDKFTVFRTLHGITFQKASSKDKEVYLSLFNRLKIEISKASYSLSYSSRRYYSSQESFRSIKQSLLGLALKSEDEAALRHVILRHKSALIGNPYAVIMALRYGKVDLAHSLWKNAQFSSGEDSDFLSKVDIAPMGLLDDTLMKSLEAFIKRDPNDSDRQLLRDAYWLRANTFDEATKPSIGYVQRYVQIAGKNLHEANYDGQSASMIVDTLLTSNRFRRSTWLNGKLEKLLLPAIPKIMEDLRKETEDDFSGNWKTHYFKAVALYFRKLIVEDNLKEFLSVTSQMNAAAKAEDHNRCAEPLFAASAELQVKLFDAIEAGDLEKIKHYRKYLEVMAANAICHTKYYYGKNWSLPVALLGICYAYSETPKDFVKFKEAQIKRRRTDKLDNFATFMPLKFAYYKGKKLSDAENRGLRLKLMKKIINASQDGLFNFASVYSDGIGGAQFFASYGGLLTDEDLLELYEYAHTVNPVFGNPLSAKGHLYNQKKEYKKAEETFHRAVVVAQNTPKSKWALGTFMYLEAAAMAKQGKYKQAVAYAESIPQKRRNRSVKNCIKRSIPAWKKAKKK